MKTTIKETKLQHLLLVRKLEVLKPLAKKQVREAKQNNDLQAEIEALFLLAEAHRIKSAYLLSKGDWYLAEQYITEAMLLCHESSKTISPKLLLCYGRLHLADNNESAALSFYHQALNWSKKNAYLPGQNLAFAALSQYYLEKNDFTQALRYAKSCGEQLDEHAAPDLWLNYHMRIGFVFARRHQYTEILTHFEAALLLSREIGDVENEVLSLQNIAVAHASRSAFKEAFQYFLASLKKGESIQFKLNNIKCLVNVGTIFSLLSNYKEAEKRYVRVLQDYGNVIDKNTRIVLHYNIGNLHFQQKRWGKAKRYLALCLELANKEAYQEVIAQVLTLNARIYCEQGKPQRALEVGKQAAALYGVLGNSHGKQVNLVNLGLFYFKLNELDLSLDYAQQGLALAQSMLDKTAFAEAYQLLSDIYRKKNNYEKAFHYQAALTKTKDQLYVERLDRQLVDLEIQTEIVEYREQVQQLKREEREYQDKIAQLQLKALQAQMNPHFIFNSMNAIQHFLSANDNESAMIFLARFAQLIRSIFDYSQRTTISLKEELAFLRLYLDLEGLRFQGKTTISLEVDKDIDQEKTNIPPLLVQPIIENAFKHGLLHKPKDGILLVSFEKQGNLLRCTVEDNGVGRHKAKQLNDWKPNTKSLNSLEITRKRLALLKQKADFAPNFSPINVIDLVDGEGKAAGTRVVLVIGV